MVKTDFLFCGNRFHLFDLFIFYKWKPLLTKISENKLFWERIRPTEMDFRHSGDCFLLSMLFSCKWKPLLKRLESSDLYFL